jgi:hypothetical protein
LAVSLPHQTTGDLITAAIWNAQVDAINTAKSFADDVKIGMPFLFGGSALYPTINTAYPTGATLDKLAPSTGVLNLDAANLSGATYALEAILAVEGGATVSLALVNLTDGAPNTAIVTITSTSATGAKVTSGTITFATPGAAKDYAVKIKSSNAADRAYAWGIRLIRTS